MNTRELWNEIMHYGRFDRMPVCHWAGWPETRQRWIREGMPADADEHRYLNTVPMWMDIWTNFGLFPAFEEEVYEETDEYRICRAENGVVQKEWKHRQCIPHFMDFTLRDAGGWPDYKRRLQPDPQRLPANLQDRLDHAESCGFPVALRVTPLMGWIRNWMGVANMCYLMHDAPEVYADMVDTLADLSCWIIDHVVPQMKTPPDMIFIWEDICGKAGPLVSPSVFEQHVAPGYAKIRRKMEEHGIRLLGIDSDGDIEQLAAPWFHAGVNLFFPIEIGSWDPDPMEYRTRFGRELRILGGFNKMVLEQGPEAIDAEIQRRLPLLRDGGFVILPDHLITPGVSLANYRYYLEQIRCLRLEHD